MPVLTAVYFLLALGVCSGLAWLINIRMAQSLVNAIVEYQYIFMFGLFVFAGGLLTDCLTGPSLNKLH